MAKEISIAEMRKIQIEILDKIDFFCKAHHLRYSLCGGTLLGAVRHKGYIPWDDDIDILMPRPDYEKFLTDYRDKDGAVVIQHYKNDITYPLRWARAIDSRTKLVSVTSVSGVFVDIFPVDGLPSPEEAKSYEQKLRKIKKHLVKATKYQSEALHKNALYLELKYFVKKLLFKSREKVLAEYEELFNSYDFEKSEFAGAIVSRFGAKETLPSSVFKEYIELDFEGKQYSCLKNYDLYLKTLYGDYMQLPPEEKRKTHHRFKVYWKE